MVFNRYQVAQSIHMGQLIVVNISDDMSKLCEAYTYQPTAVDKLRDTLGKCGIASSTFYNAFNEETGAYTGSINCSAKGLNDEDLNSFAIVKSVGGYLYLQNNQLTHIDGLSSLVSVGQDLMLFANDLSTLNGLSAVTNVGGTVSFYDNPSLTDISGLDSIVAADGKRLYLDNTDQYLVKASGNSDFCSSVWDLYTVSGNIADDMSIVCDEAEETPLIRLRNVLNEKCNTPFAVFADNFDESSGVYTGSIDCAYHGLTNEELSAFSIITEIKGSLSLNNNELSNVDGLSNINAISGYLYLYENQITRLEGLGSLNAIGGDFDLHDNNLSDLAALVTLQSVGGSLSIRHNSGLIDIYGLFNIQAVKGAKLMIDDTAQYISKPDAAARFCSEVWDLYGEMNIEDDMRKVCEGYDYQPNDVDRFRELLGAKCGIDSLMFYETFDESTGIYEGSIDCSGSGLDSEALQTFKVLMQVSGDFSIANNLLSSLDGIIRLERVGGSLSIDGNADLVNVAGLSNIEGSPGQKLVIDDTRQYSTKADTASPFCSVIWDLFSGSADIDDDMQKVCVAP
jgi:hypothetical protein